MPGLFDPLTIRGVRLRNRIGMAPMCQATSAGGYANDWHLVHLGARATGGAALVLTESTAVAPEARITERDLGLWCDEQVEGHARICRFIAAAGAVPGIQLGHAGRKSSYRSPWGETGMQALRGLAAEEGGWPIAGPSALAFDEVTATPHEMTERDIAAAVAAFAAAAARADEAGYDCVEIHAAHGYLLHSFCSPLSNHRTDRYGGTFENRVRLCRETSRAVRAELPDHKVLAFRISHTDWVEGGWCTEDSVALARLLRDDGVDLVDVSSGGSTPAGTALARHLSASALGTGDHTPPVAVIPIGPGYQVPGAEAVRRGSGLPVAAVGLITDPAQADAIVREGRADLVLLGRELLRDPNWPLRAALELHAAQHAAVPCQYFLSWRDRGDFRYVPTDPSTTLAKAGAST